MKKQVANDVEWSEPALVEYEFTYGAKRRPAVARLGFPRRDEANPGEWVCSFQVQGLKESKIRRARSNEGMHSLTIANNVIRKSLEKLKSVHSDLEPYEVVFPRLLPSCYGLEFHWKLCKLVDAETKKKERQLSRKRQSRKKSR